MIQLHPAPTRWKWQGTDGCGISLVSITQKHPLPEKANLSYNVKGAGKFNRNSVTRRNLQRLFQCSLNQQIEHLFR
jgi:hypothetical protein